MSGRSYRVAIHNGAKWHVYEDGNRIIVELFNLDRARDQYVAGDIELDEYERIIEGVIRREENGNRDTDTTATYCPKDT